MIQVDSKYKDGEKNMMEQYSRWQISPGVPIAIRISIQKVNLMSKNAEATLEADLESSKKPTMKLQNGEGGVDKNLDTY